MKTWWMLNAGVKKVQLWLWRRGILKTAMVLWHLYFRRSAAHPRFLKRVVTVRQRAVSGRHGIKKKNTLTAAAWHLRIKKMEAGNWFHWQMSGLDNCPEGLSYTHAEQDKALRKHPTYAISGSHDKKKKKKQVSFIWNPNLSMTTDFHKERWKERKEGKWVQIINHVRANTPLLALSP